MDARVEGMNGAARLCLHTPAPSCTARQAPRNPPQMLEALCFYILYCTVLHCTVLHPTLLYRTLRHRTVLNA